MDRRIGILSQAVRNRCAVYSPHSTGGRNTGGSATRASWWYGGPKAIIG